MSSISANLRGVRDLSAAAEREAGNAWSLVLRYSRIRGGTALSLQIRDRRACGGTDRKAKFRAGCDTESKPGRREHLGGE